MTHSVATPKFLDDISKLVIDAYDRPARLVPALLVLTPIPVLIVCLMSAVNPVGTSLIAILGYCGAGFALARFARNAGKHQQSRLFDKWGGAPTTQLLRHRNDHFDPITKKHYHAVLSKGIGHSLPATLADEEADIVAADHAYRAATTWLIGQTRDSKKFSLVFKENVAFGFHRNALGVRPYGIAVAVICLFAALVHSKLLQLSSPFFDVQTLMALGPLPILAMTVSAILLIAWLFWFDEAAAKEAGFAYAERLVQSCDQLSPRNIRKSTAAKAST